jgi:PAS domain S-box-containing protein
MSTIQIGQSLREAFFELWGSMGNGVVIADLDGVIRDANSTATDFLIGAETSVAGRALSSCVIMDDATVRSTLIHETRHRGEWVGELVVRGSGGTLDAVGARSQLFHDEDRRPAGIVLLLTLPPEPEQARDSDGFWQATIDSLTAEVAVFDGDGSIMAVNEAWRRSQRRGKADCDPVGLSYLPDGDATVQSAAHVAAGLKAVLAGSIECFEYEYTSGESPHTRWSLMRATRHAGATAQPQVVVTRQDVTARRHERAHAELQAALLDEIDVAVIAGSVDHTITSWNAAARQLYGWSSEEAIGRRLDELIGPAEGSPPPGQARGAGWDGECVLRRKDGSPVTAYTRTRVITDSEGRETAMVVVSMDMRRQLEAQHELRLARDYLRAVTDSMAEGMYTLDVEGRVTYINAAAQAQLGWSHEELQGRIMHDCSHYRRSDGSPLPIEECEITRARSDGEVVRVHDDLFIRRDGTAMPVSYTAAPFATEDGVEGCVVVFQDTTERRVRERQVERDLDKLAWVKRIRQALAEDRFILHAQPIVELATGNVIQHELLIRMRGDDAHDLIAPGRFLPIAEEYGFITDSDLWVVDRAAEIAATGQTVELNVSAASIGDTKLVRHIERAIRRTATNPSMMVFEITETAVVQDEAAARDFVTQLHTLGCKVALDDFGTGYGGFTYLKQLPIVSLAHNFHLSTVGEGIEDQATFDLLRELGVDYAQGYHIGRPAPLE